ncbi:MAG TPA: S8 family serine peptidase [Pyrinomonadaceae bacterium]|jgi:uncharacterized repeat protein (TIGR01451 family)
MSPSLSRRKAVVLARRSPRRVSLLCLLLVASVAALPHAADAVLQQQTSAVASADKSRAQAEFVPGEILVRFRNDAQTDANGAQTATTIPSVGQEKFVGQQVLRVGGREISLTVERLDASEMVDGLRLARVAPQETMPAIDALNARPDVLYAEPNYVRRASRTPNDPRYAEMWALKNTGQQGGVAGADIDAEPAWDVTTGDRQIVVGVVDSGIDINHPDLRDNIWRNPAEVAGNHIDDDGNGFVDDVHGYDFFHNDGSVYDGAAGDNSTDAHGTHVAGTIGATGNNGTGVTGVNWQTSLMSLKILGRDDEAPAPSSVLTSVRAYNYARMMRELWTATGGARGANIRILNNSYGGYGRSQAELDAIRALAASNILFVAAAGNEHNNNDDNPAYPASYDAPNLVSVTVMDRRGEYVFGSFNFGQRTVHMGAPGLEILSTTPNGTYSVFDGSSMAAPHVAGAAALICAANPVISVARMRSALLYSGDEVLNLLARTTTGRALNVAKALESAAEADSTPPAVPANFHVASQTGRSVRLEWIAPGDDGNAGGRAAAYEIRYSDAPLDNDVGFAAARPVSVVVPRPSVAGTTQFVNVRVPFQHTNGFFGIRALDNAGNASGVASAGVAVEQSLADPYVITQSAAGQLTTGGQPLGLRGDDAYLENYQLPYNIQLFGQNISSVSISSNGALYFSLAPDFRGFPRLNDGRSLDAFSSVAGLNNRAMIAGLWDDLRTDRRAGDDVYMLVEPTRVVFRWQAVTYSAPYGRTTARGEQPVNFEIELGRNGTIQLRYGAGQNPPTNTRLFPVVGLSGGEDAYVVASHTSEAAEIALTNAQTVSFTPRNPPPVPASDMQLTMTDTPDPVFTNQLLTYTLRVTNQGTHEAYNVVVTDQLPAGTTFVSCNSFGNTCTANAGGTVTANINGLGNFSTANVVITVRVNAPPDTSLVNTATVTSLFPDPNPSNNSASTTTRVITETFFGNVRSVVAGFKHTLIVRNDGTVWAWGDGSAGKLGEGGVWASKLTPLQVSGLTDVTAVAAGEEHSLALRSDGTVWAWGSNVHGLLGEAGGGFRDAPQPVAGLTNITAIAAGGQYNVALRSDGTLWSWGLNNDGLLGIGNTSVFSTHTPTQVAGLDGVVAIAAGRFHTLALRSDGTVWAWGINTSGQMGIPTSTRVVATPMQINGLANIKAIAAGLAHTVALRNDGVVLGLGSGSSGQLGTNSSASSLTPVQPVGMTSVAHIAAGSGHTLALKTDGTLWAWGANSNGELGEGTSGAGKSRPVQVSNIAGVVQISAKENSNAALLNDGTVRMWGNNTYGQLGDGSNVNRATPTPVSGLASVSTPTFSHSGTSSLIYTSPIRVRLSCITEGALIHYTKDGREPTESDPAVLSGESVFIESFTTLKAKAFRGGWTPSSTKETTYYFTLPPNRIDDARFFVEQHYRDFFSREADAPGLAFWMGVIHGCASLVSEQERARCIDNRRTNVSGAFFLSVEFQNTGYLVYRMEKASYARMPRLATFLPDTQAIGAGIVVNAPGWEAKLEENTRAFLDAWVNRAEFTTRYPASLTADEYVNRLFANAGFTPDAAERAELVNGLNGGTETRATVLRKVAENAVFSRQESNRAFVLMQYFGYLRRNPDDAPDNNLNGYNFWLNKLNEFGGDFVRAEMVRSFLISGEYRQRFPLQ